MFFDARAVLTEILQSEGCPPATSVTLPAAPVARVADVASVAGGGRQNPDFQSRRLVSQVSQVSQGVTAENWKSTVPAPGATPYSKPGCMVRLAWSGEWVSADRYAEMTDLERHGPQGRLFCGKCWQYRDREKALGCLDGEGCA